MAQLKICFCMLLLFLRSASADEYTVLYEHYPPNSFVKSERQVEGFLVDLTKEIFKQANLNANYYGYPWSRAYKTALSEKNTLIVAMRKTPERERLFHWAGTVFFRGNDPWNKSNDEQIVLFSDKLKPIDVSTLEQAKQYSVSFIREDALIAQIKPNEIWSQERILLAPDWPTSIQQMLQGRVSFVAGYKGYMEIYLDENPEFRSRIHEQLILDTKQQTPLYFAFNINTSMETIDAFNKAHNKVMNNGTYHQLLAKWRVKLQAIESEKARLKN